MFYSSKLPIIFCAEVIHIAVHIFNRTATMTLLDKTPYEA
jgi:hypothetical protein